MQCRYEGDKNHIAEMSVQQKDDSGAFQPLEINNRSAGFLIFVYSLFSCQHLYMFTNAAEHGLILDHATGFLDLSATENWMLTDLRVRFEAKLKSGTPSQSDIETIQTRMNQCPVSRNIHPSGAHESKLVLIQ